jgi:hypothetical protein
VRATTSSDAATASRSACGSRWLYRSPVIRLLAWPSRLL